MGYDEDAIRKYVRAANYLSVAQVFLQDNFLLERGLEAGDVKSRLLGHWGTCPGINKIYAHLNAFGKRREVRDMMFVMGPGHGFAALQANLFLEGTLGKFDEKATRDAAGIEYVSREFSWPGGFPSHSSPVTPGVILEGGELGYCLSTAYGAVLDNPDLVAACLIGDGELETSAALAAMNLNKLVSPKSNGVVLPILHLNGYKITGPTIYGRMSDKELVDLLSGFGYEPLIVEAGGDGYSDDLMRALERAFELIGAAKRSEREFSRLPFIVMRTEKGETGPVEFGGEKIVGNYLSHQVILGKAKTDAEERELLEEWLRSYRFEELFDRERGFGEWLEAVLLEEEYRMGVNRHAFGRKHVDGKLQLPVLEAEDLARVVPHEVEASGVKKLGEYLRDVMAMNAEKKNFRVFCPDETESNKLGMLYEVTDRQWLRPLRSWDKNMAPDGRISEILSEDTLQGMMQGYVLTGRNGVLASYEAFMPVAASMVDQYVKFLAQANSVEWRGKVAAMNYVLTSVGWRQDHNGYSHQNPSFISGLLHKPSNFANVLLPVDDVAALAAAEFCLKTKNVVNVVTVGKTEEPRWIDFGHARFQLTNGGASIFEFASEANPDVIVASAGDYVSKEALAAVEIVKRETPGVRVRFVNVAALSYGAIGTTENKLSQEKFREMFTEDRPIIFNFHGYEDTMRVILANYTDLGRVVVEGYREMGSTTTPYDMQARNGTSRWSVAKVIWKKMVERGVLSEDEARWPIEKYSLKFQEHWEYVREHGVDLPEISEWRWGK